MTFKRQLSVTQDISLAPSKQESLGLLHVFLPMKLKKLARTLRKDVGPQKRLEIFQPSIKIWSPNIEVPKFPAKICCLWVFFWRHDASISAVYWSKSDEEKTSSEWIFTQKTLFETNIACENWWLEGDPFLLGRPVFRDENVGTQKSKYSTIWESDLGPHSLTMRSECHVWVFWLKRISFHKRGQDS